MKILIFWKSNFYLFEFCQRIEKLNEFKEEKLNVMVATDLAARGLDIANVKTVINFAMPMTFKHYIHRVGRTARAQNSGRLIVFLLIHKCINIFSKHKNFKNFKIN